MHAFSPLLVGGGEHRWRGYASPGRRQAYLSVEYTYVAQAQTTSMYVHSALCIWGQREILGCGCGAIRSPDPGVIGPRTSTLLQISLSACMHARTESGCGTRRRRQGAIVARRADACAARMRRPQAHRSNQRLCVNSTGSARCWAAHRREAPDWRPRTREIAALFIAPYN